MRFSCHHHATHREIGWREPFHLGGIGGARARPPQARRWNVSVLTVACGSHTRGSPVVVFGAPSHVVERADRNGSVAVLGLKRRADDATGRPTGNVLEDEPPIGTSTVIEWPARP